MTDSTGADPALEELREAYNSASLIVLAGAGVSAAAGLPDWKRLVQQLASHAQKRGCADAEALAEIARLAERQFYIDALSEIKDCLGGPEFCSATERLLDDRAAEVPEIATAIAALGPKLKGVLTTNLDHLLERAFAGKWPVLSQATGDVAQRDKCILKLHGTLLDRNSWVLTRDQYDRAIYADPKLKTAFTALFHACRILFVGYGLDDDDFNQVLDRVRAFAGEQAPRHFALVPAESITRFRRKRLEGSGVRLIGYANPDGTHAGAVRILRELRPVAVAAQPAPEKKKRWTAAEVMRLIEEEPGLFDAMPEGAGREGAGREGTGREGSGREGARKASFSAHLITRLFRCLGLEPTFGAVTGVFKVDDIRYGRRTVDIVIGTAAAGGSFVVAFGEDAVAADVPSRLPALAHSLEKHGGEVKIYAMAPRASLAPPRIEMVAFRDALEPLAGPALRAHARHCMKRWTADHEARFVPGRARLPGGQELPVADAIDQALGSHRCALVLGDFGTGKSTQLARKASTMALAYLEDPRHAPAPVFLPLAGMRPEVAAIVAEHCKELPVEAFRLAVALGVAVPLFDGLDELILEPHAADGALASLASAFDEDRARFVVTSRKTLFPTKERMHAALAGVRSAAVVDLQELDQAEVADFVRKATPSEAEAESALASIAETHDLESLAQRPALLDLIVRNRKKLSHEGMTAARLYELVAEEWLGSRKAQEQSLQLEQRLAFARSLARRLFASGESSASLKQVMHEVIEILPEGSADIAGQAGREVRTAAFLVFDEKADRFRFAHRSFLEYFLAVDIALRIDAHRPDALDLPRITPEIVAFLAGIEGWDARCRALRAVLSSRYERRVSENALLAIYYGARARVGEGEALGEALEKEIPAGARLSGASLEGVDLPWIFLSGADLSGANLSEAELCFADLRGARLDRAKADHAVFNGALLDGARMVDADLFAASFVDASLQGVLWEGVDCEGAVILQKQAPRADETSIDTTDSPLCPIYQGRENPVSIAWSPDNRWLACATDDAIRIIDAVTGVTRLILAGHESEVHSVVFSPDGQWLASGSSDNSVRLWDACTGALLRSLEGHEDSVNSVVFSPDGRWLASGSSDNSVRLWDTHTGSLLRFLEGHQHSVFSVVFSPSGRWLASSSQDRSIRLWDADTGSALHSLEGHQNLVYAVVFSPDGRWLASGSYDHSVRLWDAYRGSLLHTLEGHQNGVLSVAFSPDGRWLASGSYDRSVRLWYAHADSLRHILEGHQNWVLSVVFSPDGRWLASGSYDYSVRLWDPYRGTLLRSFEGYRNWVGSVGFSPDGRWLASGSYNDSVRIWDTRTGLLLRSLQGHQDRVHAVVFSPDGRSLASASSDHSIRLWDVHTGSLLRSLEGHRHSVYSVAFSPDGRSLASGSDDHSVGFWDAYTGSLLRSLEGHQHCVRSVVFSPDGRSLASGSYDHSVRIWDAQTGALLHALEGHQHCVRSVVFSPDGRRIASSSDDRSIRLWDAHTGSLLRTVEGHPHGVLSVVFSPEGRWLASGSSDHCVHLWDAHTGSLLRTLEGHQDRVRSVVFSPDGRWLASGSSDHSIRIWNPDSGECLAILYATESGWITLVEGTPFFIAGGDLSDVIRFISGSRIMPAELWAPLFDRPDIVQAALAGKKPDLAALGLDSYGACAEALQAERARRGLIRRRKPRGT